MAMSWSFGQAIFSEYRRSRPGSLASRSTKSMETTPWARPSAVSTESVSRCLELGFTTNRATITSMECFFCLSSTGGSVSCTTSPSTRTRANPSVAS